MMEMRRLFSVFAGAACSLVVATCSTNLDPVGIRPTGKVLDASTDVPLEASIDASADAPDDAWPDAFAAALSGQAEDCFIVESTAEVRWRLIGPAGLPDGGTESATYFPGAIGGIYLQALAVVPNTGHEYAEPGSGPLLLCPVSVPQAGRYQVWVRAYARDTTDNSMHVGMDNLWPATGRSLQVCQSANVFNQWTWTSSQYLAGSSETCVGPRAISLDVTAPGQHLLMFSVREDDFRFDAWLLTLDETLDPNNN